MVLSFETRAQNFIDKLAALEISPDEFAANEREVTINVAIATGFKVVASGNVYALRSPDHKLQARIRDKMKTIRIGRYAGVGATVPLEVIYYKLEKGVYVR